MSDHSLSAEAVHQRRMRESLEYRREVERTKLASDVAIAIVRYRAEHNLTQSDLAHRLGMHQPAIARLEAGDTEPSVATLSKLAQVLGIDMSIEITPERTALRAANG